MSPTGLLIIDTKAIVSNWQRLSRRLKGDGLKQCAAVVKADAYGLGAEVVALELYKAGCQHFFVATLHEGVGLRVVLGDLPNIYVLGGLSYGCVAEWYQHGLTPVLYDRAYVDQWVAHCKTLGQKLPCVLKVDTGMHRLGLDMDVLNLLLNQPEITDSLNVKVLMSHLACSDLPDHEFNQVQLERFSSIIVRARRVFPGAMFSFANSSGIFLGESFHFDMVRPGAALYGINPTIDQPNPMSSVVRLQLPVVQRRVIPVGDSVGYGATFCAQRETRLAVVFGGYADGLFRLLSNRGYGYCGGQKVPIVGRVSMDSMVFDVTDIDVVPDSIELLNSMQDVSVLGESASTFGYEVLTNLGARYQRSYLTSSEE